MCIYWIASHSGPHYINWHRQANTYRRKLKGFFNQKLPVACCETTWDKSKSIETRQLTAKHKLNKRQLETIFWSISILRENSFVIEFEVRGCLGGPFDCQSPNLKIFRLETLDRDFWLAWQKCMESTKEILIKSGM